MDNDVQASLARLQAEIEGHWRLDEERFRARDAAQAEVARALEGFKEVSNEWRGALADLSNTKISHVEYAARNQQLEDKIEHLARDLTLTNRRLDTFGAREEGADRVQTRAEATRQFIIYTVIATMAVASLIVSLIR